MIRIKNAVIQILDGVVTKNNCVFIVANTVLLFFLLNLVYYYWAGVVIGLPYPKNSPLPLFKVHLGDFDAVFNSWRCCEFKAVGYGASYFPSLYLLADAFDTLDIKLATTIYLFIFSIFTIGFIYYSIRDISCVRHKLSNAMIIGLLTYPFMFNIVTGNYEAYVFIFISLFFIFYRVNSYNIATFFLAFAISMKAFPIVFVLLIFSQKRYIDVARVVFFGMILTILPLAIYNGGLENLSAYLRSLHASQSMYKDLMYYSISGVHYGHSLLNGMWALLGNELPIRKIGFAWYIFIFFVFIFVLHRIIVRNYPDWQVALISVILYCLLPITSTDYKLIYFIIPIFLLFLRFSEDSELQIKIVPFILIILLIVSKSPIYLHSYPFFSLNTIANPLIMIVLLAFTLFPYKNGWYLK